MLYRAPLLRVVVPFAMGIVAHSALLESWWAAAWLLFFGFCGLFMYRHYLSATESYPDRHRFGVLSWLVLLCAGIALTEIQLPQHGPKHYCHSMAQSTGVLFQISETPVVRNASARCTAEALAVQDSSGWKDADGWIMASFKPCEALGTLNPGDVVYLGTGIRHIEPPLNPGEFDYATYLSRKDVYGRVYADSLSWSRVASGNKNITHHCADLRSRVLRLIGDHCSTDETFAVLAALLVGETDFMEGEMMDAYSGAGVIHVLAVSGMHVGLIYLAVLFILQVVLGKRLMWVQFALVLISLWLFAGLSGFSASVLRATLMFSVMSLGQTIRRRSDAINNLSASALILLFWDTDYLYDVGFQLSFSAVAGIVVIAPSMQQLLDLRNRWQARLWQMVCVTTAAQLATLPFIAFYFHQFPTYFLIANLIIVPFSTLIIYAGVALMLLSWIPWIGKWLGYICEQMVFGLNHTVTFFSQLPGSRFNIGHPDLIHVAIWFGMIVAIQFMFDNRWRMASFIGTSLISVLMVYDTARLTQLSRSSELTFLAAGKGQLIISRTGREVITVADSSASGEKRLWDAIHHDQSQRGVSRINQLRVGNNIQEENIIMQNSVIVLSERIILLDTSGFAHGRADYLLVPMDQIPFPEKLGSLFLKTENIILPSAMSRRRWEKLRNSCPSEFLARLYWLGEGAIHEQGQSSIRYLPEKRRAA